MKKLILLATILLVCSQAINAQEKLATPQQKKSSDTKELIEKRIDQMDDLLDLSDKQEDQLEKIFKKYITKEAQMTPEQIKSMSDEIKKVLNPKQKAKYEEMGQRRHCEYGVKGECPHQHQHQHHQNHQCPHQR